jgi:aryl-alcohol dehydrogenase-like predicted oxidoreductase
MTMPKRNFGEKGPAVGAVGFGAMSFGGFYGASDEATSHDALRACLETGTTHWDTANVYGPETSENYIGSFLAANPGVRDQIHLATKGSIWRNPETGVRGFTNDPDHLRSALEASLTRLGVDHVDLYYVHRRDPKFTIEEVMGTIMEFKAEGKIGAIGLSEVAPFTIRRAAAVGPVAAVQSEYSLWTRLPEMGVIQACKEIGAAFVAFSPVGRGFLTGNVTSLDSFSPQDFRRDNPRFIEPNFSANLEAIRPLRDFAKKRGLTEAQISIGWTLAQGDHIIPIPGTRFANRVVENAGSAMDPLTADDLAELNRILPPGFAHGERYNAGQNIGPERYG